MAAVIHADAEGALNNDAWAIGVGNRFMSFLRNFMVSEPAPATEASASQSRVDVYQYLVQLKQMKDNSQTTMYVNFGHIIDYDLELAKMVAREYYRVEPYLRRAVYDVMYEQYPANPTDDHEKQEFFVSFDAIPAVHPVRDLKTELIGQLVAINGTVTRTSEVRPELLYGVFVCDECGQQSGRVEQQFKYTQPTVCTSEHCGNRSKWTLDVAQSKFVDWQRVRVQENSDEIPPGSMPRSVDVILRNAIVERAKAGDKCTFAGTMIVVPDVAQLMKPGMAPRGRGGAARNAGAGAAGAGSEGITGLKALGVRDLTYRTAFLASSVTTENARQVDDGEDVSGSAAADLEAEVDEVVAMSKDPALYENLIKSIAPTVHGHSEIKRGILLMLLGGLQKTTHEGMRLRGDINVCIVGDPATAKSQFLKYTTKFVPRAVYTSGKASSAAGLTASVAKDPDTGEFTIEAGALMLADNGICCIDEFDKMDPSDQVAIHEAMEQQTISITKAGIQATLNARTSILAAANPIYGRYDRSKPLRNNIALSAAIMSRFDLFFVVLDELSQYVDESIAKHIVDVHRRRTEALSPPYTMEAMQKYVKHARTLEPELLPSAKQAIVNAYANLRKADVVGSSQTSYRITVRQLESLIRLSEALARLHLDTEVKPEYVYEAFRLLRKSIIHVESAPVSLSGMEEAPGAAPGGDNADDSVVKITTEEWTALSGLLTHRIRQALDAGEKGILQYDLVEWYLEQEVDKLTTEEAVLNASKLAGLAIDKLIADGVVYVVLTEGDGGEDEQPGKEKKAKTGDKVDGEEDEEDEEVVANRRLLAYNF